MFDNLSELLQVFSMRPIPYYDTLNSDVFRWSCFPSVVTLTLTHMHLHQHCDLGCDKLRPPYVPNGIGGTEKKPVPWFACMLVLRPADQIQSQESNSSIF